MTTGKTRTPKKIAKGMILDAISGRMEELITDDLPDTYSEILTERKMEEVERHLRKYLKRRTMRNGQITD
jgi:DNA-binding IscR family transcriptional regulator